MDSGSRHCYKTLSDIVAKYLASSVADPDEFCSDPDLP